MSDLATPNGWTAAGTAEAVSLPRRHLVAIAILMCVPLPVLSLAATVIPLPQMFERAAATFSTLTGPVLGGGGSVIRERTVASGPVEIHYGPLEQSSRTAAGAESQQADYLPARGATAQGGFGPAKTGTDAVGAGVAPIDPANDPGDEPIDTGTTGSGGTGTSAAEPDDRAPGPGDVPDTGTTGSGGTGTSAAGPSDRAPGQTPKPEPPTSTNPATNQGGGGGSSKGSGGAGGSKGTAGSGGSGGSKDPGSGSHKPPAGGGNPSGPGSGTTPSGAGSGSSGGGSGSPPAGNSDPKSGGGGRP